IAGANEVGGVDANSVAPVGLDSVQEQQMFQDALKTSHGGIALQNVEPALFSQPIVEATKGTTPIVLIDSGTIPGANVAFIAASDDTTMGRQLADELISRLPQNASGTVVLGNQVPGSPNLEARGRGIKDELAAKLPNIHVLGPFDTRRDQNANLTAWQT